MKNLFCCHITTINNYEFITDEIIRLSKDYLNTCDKIMICVNDVSNNIKAIDNIVKKYIKSFELHNNNSNDWEFVTLSRLYEFIINDKDNWNIFYCHSKGVRTSYAQHVEDWRKCLLYFNIEKYKECLDYLKDYDCLGVDLALDPYKHFSGNFWWTKSSYMNKLLHPKEIRFPEFDNYRHRNEFWICSKEGNFKEIHNTGIKPLERHLHLYPREKYA